jgi:hypothetical protein
MAVMVAICTTVSKRMVVVEAQGDIVALVGNVLAQAGKAVLVTDLAAVMAVVVVVVVPQLIILVMVVRAVVLGYLDKVLVALVARQGLAVVPVVAAQVVLLVLVELAAHMAVVPEVGKVLQVQALAALSVLCGPVQPVHSLQLALDHLNFLEKL